MPTLTNVNCDNLPPHSTPTSPSGLSQAQIKNAANLVITSPSVGGFRYSVWNVRHEFHIHMTDNLTGHYYKKEITENQMFCRIVPSCTTCMNCTQHKILSKHQLHWIMIGNSTICTDDAVTEILTLQYIRKASLTKWSRSSWFRKVSSGFLVNIVETIHSN